MALLISKVFNTQIALILMLSYLLIGCNIEEPITEITVIPEQVMQTSGDHVRLSGRIIANSSLKVIDHGFEISQTEEFNTPLIISLGPKSNPGRFFGDTGNLTVNTTYFWRPFIIVGGEIRYGESSTFLTLTPSILDFNPKQGLAGSLITIEGSNFTEDIKVFVDGRNAQIKNRVLDTEITIIVPSLENNRFAKVKLIAQGTEPGFEFSTLYEYVVGKWEQTGQFVTNKYYSKTLNMVVGNQLIFGLGLEDFKPSDQLWIHDLGTNIWTPLEFSGSAVSSPFYAGPFFGGGNIRDSRDEAIIHSDEFYKYDGNQIVSLGITPFKLSRSMAFVWNDKLYVIGGELENKSFNTTIYEYDPALDNWVDRGDAPRWFEADYPHFQYQDNLYFIDPERILWRYNIESRLWETISEFPFGIGKEGISEVIGSKAYIGIFSGNRSLTEYDILQNTWLKKVAFSGDFLKDNGGSWGFDNQIYLLKNVNFSDDLPMNLWLFSPDEF